MLHTVDSSGRIIHVSDRWLEKLGYRREEVLGRMITDFMGKDTQATLDGGQLQDVIAHGELENEPRTYVAKSGDIVEVVVSATADRDGTGAVVGAARRVEGCHGAESGGAPAARGIRGKREACGKSSNASATTCARKCRCR